MAGAGFAPVKSEIIDKQAEKDRMTYVNGFELEALT